LYRVRRGSGPEGETKPLQGDFPPEDKLIVQAPSLPGEIFGYAGDSAAGENKRQFGDLKLHRTAPEAQGGKETDKA
jgi:hypothetical protein